jgi:hypothetical protein
MQVASPPFLASAQQAVAAAWQQAGFALLHATFADVSGFGATATPDSSNPRPRNEPTISFINMELLSKKCVWKIRDHCAQTRAVQDEFGTT